MQMIETPRRSFLLALGAFALMPLERQEPDVILHNGKFWTVDPKNPHAQAVAISGGRFLAVGSDDKILHIASARSRKIDLGGKTVLPGFIYAHAHPASSGRSHLRNVDCDLRSIKAIQQALRERAAKTPPGQWVLGFKYDDTKTLEGRMLVFKDLDEAVPGHPVLITHRGGHERFVNSMALKLAGIHNTITDPPVGKIKPASTGKLTTRITARAGASPLKLTSL